MMARFSAVLVLLLVLCPGLRSLSRAQDTTPPPADSLRLDSAAVVGRADSTSLKTDSLSLLRDSLGIAEIEKRKEPEPKIPPVHLIDTLVEYFARNRYPFDVQEMDIFPRSAATFMDRDASYFVITAQETPLRTVAIPYGLPGGHMTVRSGPYELKPYDRTVPMDGLIDFYDIATGDVAWAGIVEGPLAGYNSVTGGAAMLYLEPFPIPQKQAASEFTVERGAYGYAYTRGRIARTFAPGFGFAVSTDYRTGDGFMSNTDDDSYNVKTCLYKYLPYRTRADFYFGVYRREGGYSFYRRLRRDQQAVVSITAQNTFGGQIRAEYNLNLSRSSDYFKTIRPRETYADLSYLRSQGRGLYRLALRLGKEQCYINQLYKSRYHAFVDLTGFRPLAGGKLFFFARARDAENEDIAVDGAAGLMWPLNVHWEMVFSAGYLTVWPDMTDLYQMERQTGDGYPERGNPYLEAEKKLTGNAALSFTHDKFTVSASANVGRITDMIYYDRRFDSVLQSIAIMPDNDRLDYADINLNGSFHNLWLFYGTVSATARRIDSDRYGDRPPYSPRWQVCGQAGLKYFVDKFKVHLRLFGDITCTERPLSYTLEELQTVLVITSGFAAHLKKLTFYYMIHNMSNQRNPQPAGYGYSGWFYSWGINFRMVN